MWYIHNTHTAELLASSSVLTRLLFKNLIFVISRQKKNNMNSSVSIILFLLTTCLALSSGKKCGFYNKRWEKALGFCRHGDSFLRVGDINGDRRADLFCHVSNSGILHAHFGGTFATSRSQGWCSHQTGIYNIFIVWLTNWETNFYLLEIMNKTKFDSI